MNKKEELPSRNELNEMFHLLQDQITWISVQEEQEMVQHDLSEKREKD